MDYCRVAWRRAQRLHESLHVKLENWYESLHGWQSGGVIG